MESNNKVNIQVIEYNINSDTSLLLLQELSSTLHHITGSSGEASFNKKDVLEDRSIFAIARIDNEPIGCGAIRRIDDCTAEVKRMYARKNNYGVGTCVLRYLENKAKDYGYNTLICETRKINQGAVAFYLKNGFHIIENYGNYVGRDEAVCFEKKISI